MVTPIGDYDRFVENLWGFSDRSIEDRDSFNLSFNLYMEKSELGEGLSTKQDTEMRDRVWNIMKKKHGLSETQQPQQRTVRKEIPQKPKYEYSHIGKIKKKTVYARQVRVHIRKKYYTRFIDRRGRFVRVKEDKTE